MNALTPRRAGLLLGVLQAGVLLSLGAVMLVDRVRLPRAWVQTAPYDPELPIRGRYGSLQLLVPAPQLRSSLPSTPPSTAATAPAWGLRAPRAAVQLLAQGDRLAALPATAQAMASGRGHGAVIESHDGTVMARLDQPVAFFIPPDVVDPSRRPRGEELWVEVTVPADGPPRPIRLGLAPEHGGTIKPLQLR